PRRCAAARHVHVVRVRARADLPDGPRAARLAVAEGERARLKLEHACLRLRVLEHDAYCLTQLAARNLVKHRDRFREREAVSDEPRYGELSLRDQIEESLHIAVGRPTYVADGVVLAPREIVGLVDAGPHRADEH